MLFAININAFAAESIKKLPKDHVLISINQEEPEELFPLQIDRNLPGVLTLRFSDLTKPLNYKGTILNPINKEQTLQLLAFIEKYKDKNFIIHCAAGISRSAGVAYFINEKYGHSLRPDFKQVSRPNFWVINMLRTNGEYKH